MKYLVFGMILFAFILLETDWLDRIVDPIIDYYKKKKMTKFNELRQELFLNPRPLTRNEYRLVKSIDWYTQKKFFIMHLTKLGFEMYNESPGEGRNGRWNAYLRVWDLVNTPLFKAMNEN